MFHEQASPPMEDGCRIIRTMRLYRILMGLLIVLGVSASCSKDKKVDSKVSGEWELELRNSEAVSDFSVYINFRKDATFTIYQQIEASYYQSFNGTWEVEGKTLSGLYNDGAAWGSDYLFELSSDGKTMTLKTIAEPTEISVYRRCTIPEEVINSSHPEVKSY